MNSKDVKIIALEAQVKMLEDRLIDRESYAERQSSVIQELEKAKIDNLITAMRYMAQSDKPEDVDMAIRQYLGNPSDFYSNECNGNNEMGAE